MLDMNRHNARWGHSINEYTERFWSRNKDGRYTVASYTPKAVLVELAHPQSPGHPSELPLENDLTLLEGTPGPGPLNPSQSDEENFIAQLRSFADALTRRVPLQKEIMSYAKLDHLQNKDTARRKNMSSYVERVASFLKQADKQDRYIHNSQSIQELAEAGLFSQSVDATPFTSPPLLICFACGFGVSGMEKDPIERHLSSKESACPFKVGYSHRRKVQEQAGNEEHEEFMKQNRNGLRLKTSQSEDHEILDKQLTELRRLRDTLMDELRKGQGKQAGSKKVEAAVKVDDTGAESIPGDVLRTNEEEEVLYTGELEEGEIQEPSLVLGQGALWEERC